MKRPSKHAGAAHPRKRSEADAAHASGGLSAEETWLWRQVASSVEKITVKARVRDSGADAAEPHQSTQQAKRRAAKSDHKSIAKPKHAADTTGARDDGQSAPRRTPGLADFDPRKAKKLGSGRAEVGARLDLHGLRHDEAHARLTYFLRDCHGRGIKTVLVITGKGREDEGGDWFDALPRGVLRRNLPRWLDEPELRSIVVSFKTASQRHGGEGAFYIELRKRLR